MESRLSCFAARDVCAQVLRYSSDSNEAAKVLHGDVMMKEGEADYAGFQGCDVLGGYFGVERRYGK